MKRVSSAVFGMVVMMICLAWGSSPSYAFVHPGLLNTQAQYDLMKSKVAAGQNPWYKAYQKVPDERAHTPQAVANFDLDGGVLYEDAYAAYASALRWIVTGNAQYAEKAKEIVNDWAYTLKSISSTAQNRLDISWSWADLVYTAEILKHTYNNWSAADQKQFANVMLTLIVPKLQDTDIDGSNGNTYRTNWAAFGARTRIAIGIYLDNQTLFNEGISDTRTLINFYIGKHGNPVPTGFSFETCRLGNAAMGSLKGGDLQHTQYALGAFVEAAEMAKKQGVNLYGNTDPVDGAGLLTSLLYHAPFIGYPNRGSATAWPCQTSLGSINTSGQWMPWQMAANHYQNSTLKAIASYIGVDYKVVTGARWSSLTHNYYGTSAASMADVASRTPLNVRVVDAQ